MGQSTNDSSASMLLDGDTVDYTCNTGFWYPDKDKVKTATCGSDANWTIAGWDQSWDYTCIGKTKTGITHV